MNDRSEIYTLDADNETVEYIHFLNRALKPQGQSEASLAKLEAELAQLEAMGGPELEIAKLVRREQENSQ